LGPLIVWRAVGMPEDGCSTVSRSRARSRRDPLGDLGTGRAVNKHARGDDQLIADVTVVDDLVPRPDQHLSKLTQVLALAPHESLRGDDGPATAIEHCKQIPDLRGQLARLAADENSMSVPVDVAFAVEIISKLDLFAASPA
jgi:hypothetical protein